MSNPFLRILNHPSLILVLCFAGVRRCALVTASDPDLCVASNVFSPSTSATRVFIWQVLLVLALFWCKHHSNTGNDRSHWTCTAVRDLLHQHQRRHRQSQRWSLGQMSLWSALPRLDWKRRTRLCARDLHSTVGRWSERVHF